MTVPNTQPQKQFKVLLVGDRCVDEYHYGTVDRISPEAPVPVFKLENKEKRYGMAANVYYNLRHLGCDVTTYYGAPSLKVRMVEKKSKQQMMRIDTDVQSEPFNIYLIRDINRYDAIVVSDYNKGFVTYDVVKSLRERFNGPMFIDTKKTDLAQFNGLFVKINQLEFSNAKSFNDELIVTLGENGAMYKSGNNDTQYFDCNKVHVSDVTGAGDTFLSALTYKYLETKNISVSIEFAIKASSVTVQHLGCYAPTMEEICG
jgi:D-glycero-beta-D-manno-heptose-7-phosphate kinase